jgi:hypothetical protein
MEYLNWVIVFVLSISSIFVFALSQFAPRQDLAYIPVRVRSHNSRLKYVRSANSASNATVLREFPRIFLDCWRWNL